MLLCSADHGCLDSLLPMQNKNLKMFPVPNASKSDFDNYGRIDTEHS